MMIDAGEVATNKILGQAFRISMGDVTQIAALRQGTNAVNTGPNDGRNPARRAALIVWEHWAQYADRQRCDPFDA